MIILVESLAVPFGDYLQVISRQPGDRVKPAYPKPKPKKKRRKK